MATYVVTRKRLRQRPEPVATARLGGSLRRVRCHGADIVHVAYHWQSYGRVPGASGRSMPTYQYACTECGHAFEQFQSFSEDSLTECPECAASCASCSTRSAWSSRVPASTATTAAPPTSPPPSRSPRRRPTPSRSQAGVQAGPSREEGRDQVRVEAGAQPATAYPDPFLWRAGLRSPVTRLASTDALARISLAAGDPYAALVLRRRRPARGAADRGRGRRRAAGGRRSGTGHRVGARGRPRPAGRRRARRRRPA